MIYALHGMLGGPSDWDALGLDDLVALDLWSYQGSLEEVGAQIAEEVAASGDPAPVIMGYSMGGRIALHAMLARPDLWKRAIIISAHPGLASEAERATRRGKDSFWAERIDRINWPEFLKEWNAQTVIAGQLPSSSQLGLESQRRAIKRAFIEWSLGRQVQVSSRLVSCHFPVDWITGEKDTKFTELAAEMGSRLSDFRHHIVANHGHRIIFEYPLIVSRLLNESYI